MSYSIGEIAKIMNVPASTLRYYDKMGLFPEVRRENGRRVFEDKDFKWLRVLNCMKNIKMPITKIKEYLDLAQQGDTTLRARYDLILAQKQAIEAEIANLEKCRKEFEYKEWYYETAIKAGTEAVVENITSTAPTLEIDQIPSNYKNKED
jgi:DNA-binding transcriptional MerR regulator